MQQTFYAGVLWCNNKIFTLFAIVDGLMLFEVFTLSFKIWVVDARVVTLGVLAEPVIFVCQVLSECIPCYAGLYIMKSKTLSNF